MNINKYQLVIAGLILIIGFQNCQQSKLEATGVVEQPSKLQSSLVGEQTTADSSPGFPHPDEVVITSKSKIESLNGYDESGEINIKIDLQGPAAVTLFESDMVTVAGCLDNKRLSWLKGLLNGASLCQTSEVKDNNISCTQEYRLPYGALGILGTTVPLGKGNPCSGGLVYFCAEPGKDNNIDQQLKVFLKDLRNNLKSLDKCL